MEEQKWSNEAPHLYNVHSYSGYLELKGQRYKAGIEKFQSARSPGELTRQVQLHHSQAAWKSEGEHVLVHSTHEGPAARHHAAWWNLTTKTTARGERGVGRGGGSAAVRLFHSLCLSMSAPHRELLGA